MTGQDDLATRAYDALSARSLRARYLFALVAAITGIVAEVALLEYREDPIYGPFVGAVALTVWYGGLGPALLTIAVSWSSAFLLFVEPRGAVAVEGVDLTEWGVGLAVALVIVGVGGVLLHGRERATTAVAEAAQTIRDLESLQRLAAGLTGAVSSEDVARVLTNEASELLGAQGAALALIEGDELVFVDPTGLAASTPMTLSPLPLDRPTMIGRAARDGVVVRVDRRADLDASFAHSAAHLPEAVNGAISAPVHAGAEIVGAIGFLFDREHAIDDEDEALAVIVADLAGQALERALLYERERDAKEALDRILQVAPTFHAETAEEVTAAICREARTTFGADLGVLWRVKGERIELIHVDPEREPLVAGTELPLSDFPQLRAAIAGRGISFVPDVLQEAEGEGLDRVRRRGVRSSLRLPIVIGGRAELVLALSWQMVVTELDPSTIVLARRFADQAGLALEQLERRRAETEAARRADESERLQRMASSLANALTRADVANVTVDEVGPAVGADGTTLALVQDDRRILRVLAARGHASELVDAWRETPVEPSTTVARALRRRRSTIVDATPELGDLAGDAGQASALLVPLVAGRRANGLLVVSWSETRPLSDEDRRYVEALAGQAAQALDRATHFESEQAIAETLQRSVLPVSLPRIDGVQLAARYLPGTAQLEVGGDWFDALQLPDGRLGLVVGDVVGKGVEAAASMGQLRNALRAFSLERLKPASVLNRLNRLTEGVLETTFATLVYVVLEPETRICRFASAGHPPLVLACPDGRVELLEGGRSLPLGTGEGARYTQAVVEIPAGSVLLLYSDGLVERRGRSIDDGLEELLAAARAAPKDAEKLVEFVLERVVGKGEREDDIALLAVRLLPVAPRPLDLGISSHVDSLDLVRDALRVWLGGVPADRDEAQDLLLATWEACANAIEHAVDPGRDHVRVRAEADDGVVRVVIEDTGRWAPPTKRRERGLGLRLIHSLMSSVEIESTDDGTRVTMHKSIAGAANAATPA